MPSPTKTAAAPAPLKIIGFTAENFLRLSAVHISPTGNLVQITGKNGEGKTSVLNAISAALDWRNHSIIEPIHDGADKAKVVIDLGEMIVTRKFRRKADGGETLTELVVTNKEGAVFKSPQAMLDKLWTQLSMDPIEFANMDDKDQYKMLQGFVPGVNFAQIALDNAADYTNRTQHNRDAAYFMAQAQAITVDEIELPEVMVDEKALMNALEQAGATNADIATRKANRQQAAEKIKNLQRVAGTYLGSDVEHATRVHAAHLAVLKEDYEKKVATAGAEFEEQLNGFTAKAAECEQQAKEIQAKLDAAPPLPDPTDPAAIRQKLDLARTINEKIVASKKRADLVEKSNTAAAEAAKLTQRMEARQAAKEDAIRSAEMPVAGLGFGDGFITYNGHPFENASDRDKLVVSLNIAMAQNPTLRVIRAKNGSLIDSAGIAIIEEMIQDKGYQLWLERMDESGTIGFVIEDGQNKAGAE